VFPSIGDWGGQLEVAYEEGRRCMQNCWFSQTLQTRQPSHYISTILTPAKTVWNWKLSSRSMA